MLYINYVVGYFIQLAFIYSYVPKVYCVTYIDFNFICFFCMFIVDKINFIIQFSSNLKK